MLRSCRPLAGGLLAAQGDGDQGAGDGYELEAPRAVHDRHWRGARLERRDLRRHRLPVLLGGDPRAAGDLGILVDYTGGTIGASFGCGTPAARAQQFLAQIEPVLPGITSRWNGRATIDYWPGYPWTKGSYSYWKVGQYTLRRGRARGEGDCHFAGEHTSIDFQGYLNGAVETGERAAGEILADLK